MAKRIDSKATMADIQELAWAAAGHAADARQAACEAVGSCTSACRWYKAARGCMVGTIVVGIVLLACAVVLHFWK